MVDGRSLRQFRGHRAACLVAWSFTAGALSCSSAPPPASSTPSATAAAATSAERFLPLQDATVYAYDTESEITGERGMLVLEVRRPRPERADLIVAGRVTRLQLDAGGIRNIAGGWLLKEPLQVGARWNGDFGQVEVTALDRSVTTPAGSFTNCLETVESVSGADFSKRTTTTYCPGVGIAVRKTEAESNEGVGNESIRLRSHGPRVDLSSP